MGNAPLPLSRKPPAMNTDDRALADLIARLRDGDDLSARMEAADRLEAFHAKPVVDETAFERAVGTLLDYHVTGDEFFRKFLVAYLTALQSPPPVVSGEAPETFWMIELNDGSGWLSSLRGATSSVPAECLRYDSVEDANNARNRLPQSLWLKFKTNATEHKWIAPTPPVVEEGRREAATRIVELAIMRHGVPESDLEGTRDDADAIFALTPVEGGGMQGPVLFAVERWEQEVKNRPLNNVHRRSLDDAWRQVIRYYGGDDVALIGPCHDDLFALSTPATDKVRQVRAALATLGAPHEG